MRTNRNRGGPDPADPMAKLLTVELRDLVAGGEARVDLSSIVRLGSMTVRRRRNLTAGGVAAGVVALVIGGTVVGPPSRSGVQTVGPQVVPACASSSAPTSRQRLGSRETGSSTDEGSSPPATSDGSRERAAQSSAASLASAAASAAEGARAAAELSAQAAVTARSAGETYQVEVGQSPAWFTTAKGLQLTDALRSAVPAEVKVLEGDDYWLRFDGSTALGPDDSSALTPMVVANAAVFKAGRSWGSLMVSVGLGTGVPACSKGRIERRVVEKDGTVVDIGVLTNTLLAAPSQWQGSLSVTAYRPDGTMVTAAASTSGSVDRLPMTADELTALVTAPGLVISAPATPAESSLAARITTNQDGLVSTVPPTTATTTAQPPTR